MAGGGVTYNGYCDYVIQPPLACPCNGTLMGDADGYIPASDVFFGRGAIQLSWNYNFRAASEALTSDPNTFCEDPDLVATTPEVSQLDSRAQRGLHIHMFYYLHLHLYLLYFTHILSFSPQFPVCLGCRDLLLDGELEGRNNMPH